MGWTSIDCWTAIESDRHAEKARRRQRLSGIGAGARGGTEATGDPSRRETGIVAAGSSVVVAASKIVVGKVGVSVRRGV